MHDCGLLSRIREGCLTVREERGLGLPWSRELVERGRARSAGTVAAARHALEHGVAMNLGGGTHHAGRDFARGYCLFNDVAVALAELRRDGLAERALVVDCDVHQGDGTAHIFAEDPRTFTLSLHGARNYPFTRVPPTSTSTSRRGTGDARYLRALDEALDFALDRARPDFAFYLAGADPWEGDRLGRLALTKPGLRARDELVLDRLRTPVPPSASCSPAATPRTSATPSTSTPRPPRPSPSASDAPIPGQGVLDATLRERAESVTLSGTLRKVQGEACPGRPSGRAVRPPTPGQPPPLPSPGAGGTTPPAPGWRHLYPCVRAPGAWC